MQATTISTTSGPNGKTIVRVSGPSFAAVQVAISEIMDRDGIATSSFNLPRRVDDRYEAQGFTIDAAPAQPIEV